MPCWLFNVAVGALTLKTFPFELRGWELEKFNAIDLSDSFGLNILVSLNNKQIIQIEPGKDNKTVWIHDKTRQYFDSFYLNQKQNFNLSGTAKNLAKIIYLFELCNFRYSFTHNFLIVYENLSLDNLCLLISLNQKYSFIKLKQAKNSLLNNNIESNFLLNKKKNLNNASVCLLISNNLRFEHSILNIRLKQRLLKSNFKLFVVGSFINLTHNVKFLGTSSSKFINSLIKGTHFICQDLKLGKTPAIFANSEILKINNLNQSLIFVNNYNKKININLLHSTLFETTSYFLNKSEKLASKDFINFNTLYFINLTYYGFQIINKIIKTNIIYFNKMTVPLLKNSYLNQNFCNEKINFKNYLNNSLLTNYLYIPTKTFFEQNAKFINNQGLIKQVNKLNLTSKTKSNWKIIRNIINTLKKTNKQFITIKSNIKLNQNFKNNTITILNSLIYESKNNLNVNFNKTVNNHSHLFFLAKYSLKNKKIKFLNNKIKLWLNDFFIGGKDIFSKYSITMLKCSKINKLNSNNFN